jgi:hypothetical protein
MPLSLWRGKKNKREKNNREQQDFACSPVVFLSLEFSLRSHKVAMNLLKIVR